MSPGPDGAVGDDGQWATEGVTFYNHGARIAGDLRLPLGEPPFPAVVQGPGWLGLRDAKLYRPYHEAILEAGIAVLTLDYRGFGGSEAASTLIDPLAQVADIRAGLTYLETRPEIDRERLGAFGSGGTGGGNAVYAAGIDERVRAVVSQVPIADGRDWLRRMRTEHEWLAFLDGLRADRRDYVRSGTSALVPPSGGVTVPTPERRTTTIKSDVDGRIPSAVALQSAAAVIDYRPIDVVHRISPRALLLIAVQDDAVTPEDHAVALFERAGRPKRLIMQTGTTHYSAYQDFRHVVAPAIARWFRHYLSDAPSGTDDHGDDARVVTLTRPQVAAVSA